MTERTNIYQSFRETGFSALWLLAVNMLQVALLARWLQAADFAMAAYGAVIVNLCLHLQSAGINAAMVREQQWSPVQLTTFWLLNLMRGLGLFAGVALIAVFARVEIFSQVLLLHGSALLAYGTGLQYKALLQKEQQFKQMAIAEVVAATLALFVALLLAITGGGALAIAGGYAARYFIESLCLWMAGRKFFRPAWAFSWQAVKPFLGFSLYHLAERAAMFLVAQLDLLLLGLWWGNEVAGAYDALKRVLSRPAGIIAGVFDRVNFPVWSGLRNNRTSLGAAFNATVEQAAFATQPAYLFAFLAAMPLVWGFFGQDWVAYAGVFQYLCLVFMWQMLLHPIDTLLLAVGKIHWWLWAQIAFAPLLTITMGISDTAPGAVLGLACAYGLFAAFTYYFLGNQYAFALRTSIIAPLGLTIFSLITAMTSSTVHLSVYWYWKIAISLACAGIYAGVLYRFSTEIRSMVAYYIPVSFKPPQNSAG